MRVKALPQTDNVRSLSGAYFPFRGMYVQRNILSEEGVICAVKTKKPAAAARGVTEVVAALLWRGERFLICQRPANKTRGLLWEFVGGKVEPGETRQQALIRECREELAVTVEVGDIFWEVTHTYPDLTVHLTLFHAAIAAGTPQKLEHNDLRWITVGEIPQYDFCPADVEILKKLRQAGDRRSGGSDR